MKSTVKSKDRRLPCFLRVSALPHALSGETDVL